MSGTEMTPGLVWTLMCEGCNAAEIAAWAGVRLMVARAWMHRAAREFADGRAGEGA